MVLPPDRQRLVAAMLRAIAHHAVGDRPGRVEPRANKRRPKCQKLLMEPRKQAQNACCRQLKGFPSAIRARIGLPMATSL